MKLSRTKLALPTQRTHTPERHCSPSERPMSKVMLVYIKGPQRAYSHSERDLSCNPMSFLMSHTS
jgi:hypothetical protein